MVLPAARPDDALAFRVAIASNVPAIVALVTSAYRGDASRAGWTTEADLLDGQRTDETEVRGLVEDPAGAVLLAEQDGALVACCHIVRDANGDGYFGMFSVRPQLQGGRVGRSVLAAAERFLVETFGCTRCVMTVIEQRTELIAWYERRGYVRTGEQKPFPYGNPRFGIPRRPDLRFVVLAKSLA